MRQFLPKRQNKMPNLSLLPGKKPGLLDFLGSKVWEFDVLRFYLQIRQNLKFNRFNLRNYQERKLKEIIKHAYETVPFYKHLYDKYGIKPEDIRTLDDLKKLPIISKEKLREKDKGRIISSLYDMKDLVCFRTGGSTSRPFSFYISKAENKLRIAEGYRIYALHGYNIFDKIGSIAYHSPKKDIVNWIGMLRKVELPYSASDKECAETIIREKISLLDGYPSRLNSLASYIKKNKIKISSIKEIFTNSEVLTHGFRKNIENAFGIKVTNVYDCWEFGRIAWECGQHRGMHINADSMVVEIIKDGRKAKPGVNGHVVVTGLNSFAMPLIRYDLGDMASLSTHKCACGVAFPLMNEIEGRAANFIQLKSGQKITMTARMHQFIANESLLEYQVLQKSADELNINIVVEKNYSPEEDAKIAKYFKGLGKFRKVTVRRVKRIKRTSQGKHTSIVNAM